MRVHFKKSAITLAVAGAFCAAAATAVLQGQAVPDPSLDPRIVIGPSLPSEQHRVTFEGDTDGSAIIKDVFVKPGDRVKAGDKLMAEDTDQAIAYEKVLEAAAAATGAIEEAQATIDAKTQLVQMYANLKEAGNYNGAEKINAEMDRKVAVAKEKEAEEDQKQRQLSCDRQVVKIQHMTLLSPIEGIVESVNLFAGEVVNPGADKDGAVYIVSNDPLWVEIHPDAAKAARLVVHDPVEVAFPDDPGKWINGEVIFIDPLIEYTGQTRTVRVSIPNPDQRPSGLPMIVRLPAKVVDAGAVGSVQP